jgi:hypothetical protein
MMTAWRLGRHDGHDDTPMARVVSDGFLRTLLGQLVRDFLSLLPRLCGSQMCSGFRYCHLRRCLRLVARSVALAALRVAALAAVV